MPKKQPRKRRISVKPAERFMFVTDSHGDHIDWQAATACLDFKKEFKPDVLIHGGDWLDLTALRLGAGSSDTLASIKNDIVIGQEFLNKLDPHILLVGNHDYRLYRESRHRSNYRAEQAQEWLAGIHRFTQAMDINVVHYGAKNGYFRYGDFYFAHGYKHGTHAAHANASYYGHHCVIGHVHYNSGPVSTQTNHPIWGYTSGCLCSLSQEYNLGQTGASRQNHGWIYGFKRGNRLDVRHAILDANYELIMGGL